MASLAKGTPKVDAGFSYFPYRDIGCEVSPTCLQCPLPQCKYDTPGLLVATRIGALHRKIQDKEKVGTPPSEIARELGISVRTVYRVLARRKVLMVVVEPASDM